MWGVECRGLGFRGLGSRPASLVLWRIFGSAKAPERVQPKCSMEIETIIFLRMGSSLK